MSAADAHRVLQDEIDSGRIAGSGPAPAEPPRPLVLIAERDPYAAELAEYLLRTEGYDVCVAMDGIQASLLFDERSPALVVIDLLISGGAGSASVGNSRAAAYVRFSPCQPWRVPEKLSRQVLPRFCRNRLSRCNCSRWSATFSAPACFRVLRRRWLSAFDSDRLSAGSARIDEVLGGGLPTNAINLVIGAPGSGKTILTQQYVFHNATTDRPALYLSTVSEPFDKIIRYGQAMTFFDSEGGWLAGPVRGSRGRPSRWRAGCGAGGDRSADQGVSTRNCRHRQLQSPRRLCRRTKRTSGDSSMISPVG